MNVVRPAERIQRLPSHFFSGIVKRTAELMAAGHDVINLGQGNPDRPTPPHIVERLRQAAADPSNHKYPPFTGLKEFKQAVAAWYDRKFGVVLDPDTEVCVLIGMKLGLQEISLCLLEPGDVCLVPDPGYPDYWSGIALAGGRLAGLPLTQANGFLPNYDELPKEVRDQAKLLILNFPANPTGAVAPLAFFEKTVDFARRNGIVAVHDLAYGDLVFDDRPPVSFLQALGAREVGGEFGTLSKSYNMAGWRIGWLAGNRELVRTMEVLQDHLNCSQFPAVQLAAAHALTGPQDCVEELRLLYQKRRDTWVQAARSIGWREVEPCAGSFFVWCPVPSGYTARSLSELFLTEAKVVTAPGVAFGPGGEGYVRVSLTVEADRLAQAAERIGRLGVFR